jgi:acyl carrier protein
MKNGSNVEQPIKDFILSTFLPGEDPAALTSFTPLMTTGILDSIATLKLVLFLEQEFSITVAPHEADAQHLDTIDRIIKLVSNKS